MKTDPAPAPLHPQAQRYLDHVRFEKRLAERTCALYLQDLLKLQAWAQAAGLDLMAVEPHHVRSWLARMNQGGRSARGIGLILSGWRGFYVWASREGLIAANPVLGVRAPKAGKPLPKALTVDQAVRLAEHRSPRDGSDKSRWLDVRDAAMAELMYGSGLRVGELVGLDINGGGEAKGWLDLSEGMAHVLGKGSKRRSVPLGHATTQALLGGIFLSVVLSNMPVWQVQAADEFRTVCATKRLFIQQALDLLPFGSEAVGMAHHENKRRFVHNFLELYRFRQVSA